MENKEFFVHPLGVCDSRRIGRGTRIWGYSHVMSGAVIGEECNLGEHVFVENKVKIGNHCTIKNGVAIWDLVTLEDDVFVGPYVVFTNEFKPRAFIHRKTDSFRPTLVKRGASLGANSTIVCGITIGEFAMVGAGAVATKDVPPHSLVLGSPAEIVARICYCGERLDAKDYCADCKKPLHENSMGLTVERFHS